MDKTALQWAIEPLRKYSTYSGRAPRAEYWWFYLLTCIVQGFGSVIDTFSGNPYSGGVIGLALLLPTLAVTNRRLHDLDRKGWWLLAPLVGVLPAGLGLLTGGKALYAPGGPSGSGLILMAIGALVFFGIAVLLFVWFCTRGTAGPNRFGDDPFDPMQDVAEIFR